MIEGIPIPSAHLKCSPVQHSNSLLCTMKLWGSFSDPKFWQLFDWLLMVELLLKQLKCCSEDSWLLNVDYHNCRKENFIHEFFASFNSKLLSFENYRPNANSTKNKENGLELHNQHFNQEDVFFIVLCQRNKTVYGKCVLTCRSDLRRDIE